MLTISVAHGHAPVSWLSATPSSARARAPAKPPIRIASSSRRSTCTARIMPGRVAEAARVSSADGDRRANRFRRELPVPGVTDLHEGARPHRHLRARLRSDLDRQALRERRLGVVLDDLRPDVEVGLEDLDKGRALLLDLL